MSESFTIQIHSNLVKQLTDEGEKLNKKTRKPKTKTKRENKTAQSAIYHQKRSREGCGQWLQKQEENMLQEVTKKAKDLHARSSNFESKAYPLLGREMLVLNATRNMKGPPKVLDVVRNFAECACRVKQQVSLADK
ncbi:hypothetical protein HAX54_028388 [Datura stramonium]|uniref:Uncharacterized protein n=1 Tax=Datura stramonium TaxID=4076 RepID=A0ABS8V436_DATST|nr:hypothetical protein [Datura stramonium]